MTHRVERYTGGRDGEIAAMVLAIQNGEYGLALTIEEQPDLADIPRAYADGGFWIATGADDAVIGSIGLLRYGSCQAVLKKFFVAAPYRGPNGPASALYGQLVRFAHEQGITEIFLDTPSAATRSHGFYRRAGFEVIDRGGLPEGYRFPDRDSLIFRLKI
ncbi:MAG: GNAT family N-acetyltransferase [Gammaproteobacteria bacterium]|nr:GNAT family N-acetyltransferase [Gammaproteobacteria bacterium]